MCRQPLIPVYHWQMSSFPIIFYCTVILPDIQAYDPESDVKITCATGSPVSSASSTSSHSSGSEKRHLELQTELVKDGVSPGPSSESDIVSSEMEKMSNNVVRMSEWLVCWN